MPDDLERFEARCRPVIEMRRGPDGTWRGPSESAALLGDRGDVAARTPADLAGLVFGCWCMGVDLTFLGNGSGGGVKGGAGAHADAGPRRPDQSPDPQENGISDEDFDIVLEEIKRNTAS